MSKKEISIAELTQGLKSFQSVTDNSDVEMIEILEECVEMYKRKLLAKELMADKEKQEKNG